MTRELIAEVGRMLNSGMSGPAIAKRLGISTATIYSYWKQVGPRKYARKSKKKD